MRKTTKKPKRPQKTGRTGHGNTPLLTMRVDAERRARWKAAAERANMDLSEWIRGLADKAAEANR